MDKIRAFYWLAALLLVPVVWYASVVWWDHRSYSVLHSVYEEVALGMTKEEANDIMERAGLSEAELPPPLVFSGAYSELEGQTDERFRYAHGNGYDELAPHDVRFTRSGQYLAYFSFYDDKVRAKCLYRPRDEERLIDKLRRWLPFTRAFLATGAGGACPAYPVGCSRS